MNMETYTLHVCVNVQIPSDENEFEIRKQTDKIENRGTNLQASPFLILDARFSPAVSRCDIAAMIT